MTDLIDQAFEYAFPLFEMARTRYNALSNPANPAPATPNTVRHQRVLSDHRSRAVTTPNNDTLYSSCWVDLSAGPVRVQVGAQPAGRYWSVALMDAFTNHIAMLGTRLDGLGPVQASLVGPNWRGARPAGRVIEAPGNDVWLLGRWLVDGPHDLAAARATQDALTVDSTQPLIQGQARPVPKQSSDAENFLAVVNDSLARNPAPARHAALMASFAAVGLRPGEPNAFANLPAALQDAWRDRMPQLHAALRRDVLRSGSSAHGWNLQPHEIGNFGDAFALRATVALGGLAALEPVEAVYFWRGTDVSGAVIDSAHRYRITVPPQGLPCDAFWSLSVYERSPQGRLFFVDNPIGRYAVGDRTPSLLRSADGSMTLWLQTSPPTDPQEKVNWLPAPLGATHLTLRAYLPRAELREGRAAMPVVERLP